MQTAIVDTMVQKILDAHLKYYVRDRDRMEYRSTASQHHHKARYSFLPHRLVTGVIQPTLLPSAVCINAPCRLPLMRLLSMPIS